MGAFGITNTVVLIVYLASIVGVGLVFARRQKTTEDYFLAGRKMPWLVVGMSMFASLVSASTYIGLPAFAYRESVAIMFGVLMSPVVAPILIFTFYRRYRELNVTTSYEYILVRFGAAGRYATSLLFVLSRVAWLGVVIYGPALALSVAVGIELWVAILVMGVLATTYTALGGMAAVLWTDAIQFVILVAGAIWVTVSLVNNVPGGVGEIIHIATATGKFDVFYSSYDLQKMTAAAAAFSWFFVFMYDYGADQVSVQRLMSTRDLRSMAKAAIFNSISDCVINAMLLFIGLGMLAYFMTFPDRLAEGIEGDRIMPFYIMHALPAGVSGLLITAIFAAAMSSMDSGLNSIATVIVSDFVKPLGGGSKDEGKDVKLARGLTVVLGVVATGVAFGASRIGSIVEAWSTFMSLFSGPVLAIFVLGMVNRKVNFAHWLIGCIASVTITFYIQTHSLMHWVYYMPVSFSVCFVVGQIASLPSLGGESKS